jgi:hypothetical protein
MIRWPGRWNAALPIGHSRFTIPRGIAPAVTTPGDQHRRCMLVLRLTIVGDIVRPMGPSKTASRVGVSVGLAVLIVVIGSFGFGPRGLTIGVVATFLMLAWRHDNSAGLLFPIAMLIVITIAVLLLLMYLMARMHS